MALASIMEFPFYRIPLKKMFIVVNVLLQEEAEVGGGSTYGVCFVDTSIGKFHVRYL